MPMDDSLLFLLRISVSNLQLVIQCEIGGRLKLRHVIRRWEEMMPILFINRFRWTLTPSVHAHVYTFGQL
jgi:hypothetical protein